MVSKPVRLAMLSSAIATSPVLARYVYADEAAPLAPAGTGLHLIGIHDNTSANRRNPDSDMWVGFGERKAKPASSTAAQPHPQR